MDCKASGTGAWDRHGIWHPEDAIEGMKSSIGLARFGDDFNWVMKTIRLNDSGYCQRCKHNHPMPKVVQPITLGPREIRYKKKLLYIQQPLFTKV